MCLLDLNMTAHKGALANEVRDWERMSANCYCNTLNMHSLLLIGPCPDSVTDMIINHSHSLNVYKLGPREGSDPSQLQADDKFNKTTALCNRWPLKKICQTLLVCACARVCVYSLLLSPYIVMNLGRSSHSCAFRLAMSTPIIISWFSSEQRQ